MEHYMASQNTESFENCFTTRNKKTSVNKRSQRTTASVMNNNLSCHGSQHVPIGTDTIIYGWIHGIAAVRDKETRRSEIAIVCLFDGVCGV